MSPFPVPPRIPVATTEPRMATSNDPTFETRALHLFRELLDMDADQREHALRDCEPPLRARAQALLACMADDDLVETQDAQCAGLRIGP